MIGLVVNRVITCCGDDVLSLSTIVIDEASGKIVSIVSGEVEDTSMKIIRLPDDHTLLPGFIDCHVHLTIPPDDYQMDHLRKSSAEKALRALKWYSFVCCSGCILTL